MKKEISILDFNQEVNEIDPLLKSLWIHSDEESVSLFHRNLIKEKLGIEKWDLFNAKDITVSWIENHLAALSLFADETPVVILGAHSLKKNVFEKLCESLVDSPKQVFLFSFSRLDPSWIKKYASLFETYYLKLKMPAFWDFDKLVQYVFEMMGYRIDSKAAHYLYLRLGQSFYEFQNAAKVCQLNYPDKKTLNLADVEELFKSNKHIDRFRLATSFNQKKLSSFFHELINTEVDPDEMKSFFSFMVSHCVKIIDPTYMNSKKKLSKYDKEIQQAARTWNPRQLDYMLERFSELVIMCKQKKDIESELESSYLIFKKKGS